MLVEVDTQTYRRYFPTDPHPFVSELFIELNKWKVDRVIRLTDDINKPVIGLIAGIKDGMAQSPFSAPFGGFHFHKDNIYIHEIDTFINSLKSYILTHGLRRIELTLPPDVYHINFNTKTVNALLRAGFNLSIPDITCWVNLLHFNGVFTQKNTRKYYDQSLRYGLSFNTTSDLSEKRKVYDLICENRMRFGRPIYMTFEDLIKTSTLWPVDFFKVLGASGEILASAIFYQNHPDICYGVFWGDTETGRSLRVMDYLTFNLWSYYKSMDFKYMDLGISTESGIPNEGLLRFKESHEAISSLRYRFWWDAPK